MPIYRKRRNRKRYIILTILIILAILMIISFSPDQVVLIEEQIFPKI